ncbi:copper resistance protein CopC [Paenibacillus sp. GP183]|uniref:copper resistance CopC/CopD family protein n=1 Tax=Paenibacillus sp. GP183 TaxID=1882751 RepID=UPI0014959BEC|nr:copper resistance protein CopC [Paenibacillus sp. GP183]
MNGNTKWFLTVALLLFFVFLFPTQVIAHSILEKAYPEPNVNYPSSPSEIVLAFNERMENGLFYIKTYDGGGKALNTQPAEISKDQKELHQLLPKLPDGIYTVSYRIISADGHPIENSYIFTVGQAGDLTIKNAANVYVSKVGISQNDWLYWITRICYYFLLLSLTGWIMWYHFLHFETVEWRRGYHHAAKLLLMLYLIASIDSMLLQFSRLLTGFGIDQFTVILKTSAGISWLLTFLLIVPGYFILLKHKLVDGLWVVSMLAAKSINGHAMGSKHPLFTVLMDVTHLFAASVWAGGLLYILLYWRKQRMGVIHFLPVFSKAALISIITLTVTGTISTLIFLPNLQDILFTDWGLLLLAKIFIIFLVVASAGLLRFFMKKKMARRFAFWLKADFSLMASIVGIVGVLTVLNPVPQNQPVIWSESRDNIAVKLTITPNMPGMNHFIVEAKTNQSIKIKNVELKIKSKTNEIGPIQVPLSTDRLTGEQLLYACDGPFLPFAGVWASEIRVMDVDDNETVFIKDFTIH